MSSSCMSIGVCYLETSLVAQMVKRLPTMWETQVQSLGWEDPLEKEMATHSIAIQKTKCVAGKQKRDQINRGWLLSPLDCFITIDRGTIHLSLSFLQKPEDKSTCLSFQDY